jgi:hypothetical protein
MAEAYRLTQELAALTGESLTADNGAIRERLNRVRYAQGLSYAC